MTLPNHNLNAVAARMRMIFFIFLFGFLFANRPNAAAQSVTAATPSLASIQNTFTEPYRFKDISYELTLINQKALTYRGFPTVSACTAASIGMITDYWTNGDAEASRIFAQHIVDANTEQGTFSPFNGLAITDTIDELTKENYNLFIVRNSNKETLLNSLETIGPVAVLVKSGWKRGGANHMVIVSGYEVETDVITVYDPNLDKPIRLFWGTFDRVWKINYTGRKDNPLTRTFFIILPKYSGRIAAN